MIVWRPASCGQEVALAFPSWESQIAFLEKYVRALNERLLDLETGSAAPVPWCSVREEIRITKDEIYQASLDLALCRGWAAA